MSTQIKQNSCKRKFMLVAFTMISLMATTSSIQGETLNFYQMDFNLAGNVVNDSDWGAVDFTYRGQDPMMYFNLSVNGSWQVQNVRVLGKEGVGIDQMMRYYFYLGVSRGNNVDSINYDYSFTPDTITSMPGGTATASVVPDQFSQGPGLLGGGAYDVAPAKPLVGGKVADNKKHSVDGMPNQEANDNGCAPTAFSNSLQFLKKKKNLHLKDSDISVSMLEEVVGYDSGEPNKGIDKDWYNLKKNYASTLGITTRKIEAVDIKKLVDEIDDKQDIELVYEWDAKDPADPEKWVRHSHMLVMAGITPLENGKYSIDTKDDGNQGHEGGLRDTTWTYDPNTGEMVSFFRTRELMYAVVECQTPEPATVLLLGLGLIGLAGVRRKYKN